MKIWLKRILVILMILSIGSFGLSLYRVKTGQQLLPSIFGYSGMSVISGSMEPAYSVGDYLLVKQDNQHLQVGDVVTYRADEMLITHRITEIVDENYVVTKGDANNAPDGVIAIENIIGETKASIPFLGYLMMMLNDTNGIYVIMGILALIVLWPFSTKKHSKNQGQPNTKQCETL